MAEEVTESAGPGKKSLLENKLVMLMAIVLVQGGMAFAAMKFLIGPASQPGAAQATQDDATSAAAARQRGELVSLQEMVVSLSTGGRPRYLKTTIAIEAENAKVQSEIEARMAEFRDAAIMRLSSHTPDDLRSFEGKESVKAEIKDALKSLLAEGQVLNVYFSDFVVQ